MTPMIYFDPDEDRVEESDKEECAQYRRLIRRFDRRHLRGIGWRYMKMRKTPGGVLVGGRVKSDETLGNGCSSTKSLLILENVERVVELG